MIIDSVLKLEFERNAKMIEEYEKLIQGLPRGSLVRKKSGYYYLKYRNKGKTVDEYIGKNESTVKEMVSKISLRKHYEQMLVELRRERVRIGRMMEEKI